MSIRLNDDAMRQFRVAKVFQETDEHKLSLDFSPDGRRLLSCDHSALSVFSSTRQTELCQVHMHHYLPEVACFTQQDTRALHSTSKVRGLKGELGGGLTYTKPKAQRTWLRGLREKGSENLRFHLEKFQKCNAKLRRKRGI